MQFPKFKCTNEECGNIETAIKNSVLDNFSDMEIYCSICNSKMRYIFSIGATDIAEGSCGNYETGYSKNIVSKPSHFGKYKGTKVK